MITWNKITNPLHRHFYLYGAIGFIALSLGYLLRSRIVIENDLAILFMGIFPNLFGSFATPFILSFLLAQRFPAWKRLEKIAFFGLVNLFTLAVSVLIEYLHVVFQQGAWDSNDIAASIIGGLLSMILYFITMRKLGGQE